MVRTALPLMLRCRSASRAWATSRHGTVKGHACLKPAGREQGEQRGDVRTYAWTRSVVREGVKLGTLVTRNELAESNGREFAAARAEHDNGPAGCDTFDCPCEAFAADQLGDQRERATGKRDRLDNSLGSQATEISSMPRGDSSHRRALLAGDLNLETTD